MTIPAVSKTSDSEATAKGSATYMFSGLVKVDLIFSVVVVVLVVVVSTTLTVTCSVEFFPARSEAMTLKTRVLPAHMEVRTSFV